MQAGTADYDVAIVGLGPVGAAAANLAGAAGFRTVVLERGDQPYLKPRAIVFDAEIMRVFASIGLADEIAAATRPLEGSIYLGADRKPIRTFRARPRAHEAAWHASNLFYQPQLEGILRQGLGRFPDVAVLRERTVTGVQQVDGACALHITSERSAPVQIRAKYVLACDGASSAIRKSLGVPLDDIGFEERWLVLDALVEGPMRWPAAYEIGEEVRSGRYSLMVCDPARPATLIPGVGRHRRWEYMLLPGEHDDAVMEEAWLREQLSRWIDPAHVQIVRAAVYRFRALIAQRWRIGNVFLLGDAAHQTPPFYGQGMCHGIRDAAQLIWRLRLVMDGVAAPQALDSYQTEREPHVREIIAASVAAGAEVCKTDPVAAAARDAQFRRLEAQRGDTPKAMTDVVPPIRHGIVDPASGGMRLPEFACSTQDGRLRPLDELLAGRFTLLTVDGGASHHGSVLEELPARVAASWKRLNGSELTLAPAHRQSAAIRDHGDAVSQWLAAQQAGWAIVRPDRYVYATAADRPALVAHLEKLFEALAMPRTVLDPWPPEHNSAVQVT